MIAPRAGPSAAFWEERFATQRTPWDRGAVHPALEALIEAGVFAAGTRVLVPGCGAGYEVARLAAAGCDVLAVDYAPAAAALTRERLARAGLEAQVIEADLLDWAPSSLLDAVWDQACLCALHPDRWVAYAARLAAWMQPGATLALLAVQIEREGRREGRIEGPPYHCDVNAVRAFFPSSEWTWPAPPYRAVSHPMGFAELQMMLTRSA